MNKKKKCLQVSSQNICCDLPARRRMLAWDDIISWLTSICDGHSSPRYSLAELSSWNQSLTLDRQLCIDTHAWVISHYNTSSSRSHSLYLLSRSLEISWISLWIHLVQNPTELLTAAPFNGGKKKKKKQPQKIHNVALITCRRCIYVLSLGCVGRKLRETTNAQKNAQRAEMRAHFRRKYQLSEVCWTGLLYFAVEPLHQLMKV